MYESMELLHQAIVVHVPSTTRSGYLFFDEQMGVLAVHMHAKRELSRGALVHYTPSASGSWYRARHVEIVAVPQRWATETIWFLHHLLELVAFFVPRAQRSEQIFELLSDVYRALDHEIDHRFFQKLFLCRFFILTGLYPEPRDAHHKNLLALLTPRSARERSNLFDEEKYVFLEKKMIQWIHECILLHPRADRLKTMMTEPW